MANRKGNNLFWTHLKKTLRPNALYAGPVLLGAFGICTIVAAATTLQNAVILSILTGVLQITVCVLSSALFARMPRHLRMACIALCAAAVYTGAAFVVQMAFGYTPFLYEVYAPLLAVSSLLFVRADGFAAHNRVGVAAADAITCALGYALVCCTVGAVRELLSSGTLYGQTVIAGTIPNRMAAAPFFGFITLGFLAAVIKALRRRRAAKQAGKRR